jgi:hypothetical protein
MRAYVGQTRSRELLSYLEAEGIGECTVRGELPPRRLPYFYDNGAYRDYVEWEKIRGNRGGPAPFDYLRWSRDLRWLRDHHLYEQYPLPDFMVVPDVVGDAASSLDFSRRYLSEVPCIIPVYLAVQDGAEEMLSTVKADMATYDGLFVGGSDEWKERTSGRWVQLAHVYGMRCHIGRVGTPTKVRWARSLGADSIDSSFPLFSSDHMQAFVDALTE